jgi:hypothetical protein
MIPIRLHSRTMVESGTLPSADSVMVGVVLVEGWLRFAGDRGG